VRLRVVSVRNHPPHMYVWLFGKWRRLHHGMTGAAFGATGALLMWHDRRDWPWTRDG
jgi:hypothetical protein